MPREGGVCVGGESREGEESGEIMACVPSVFPPSSRASRSSEKLKLMIASQCHKAGRFEWSYIGHVIARGAFRIHSNARFDAVELLSDRLWLGSARAAINDAEMRHRNIRYVLTVASNLVDLKPAESPDHSTIDHAVLEIDDFPECNMLPYLEGMLGWIEDTIARKNGAVLVHCAQGISRSVTVCIAYLMSRHQMSFRAAEKYVSIRRSIACPNYGFRWQLELYEKNDKDVRKALKKLRST